MAEVGGFDMDAKGRDKAATSRAERLENQLRANLRRRKDQARARAAGRALLEGAAGNGDPCNEGVASEDTGQEGSS